MADFLIKDTLLNGYNYEIFRPELKIMNKEFHFLQMSQLLLKELVTVIFLLRC